MDTINVNSRREGIQDKQQILVSKALYLKAARLSILFDVKPREIIEAAIAKGLRTFKGDELVGHHRVNIATDIYELLNASTPPGTTKRSIADHLIRNYLEELEVNSQRELAKESGSL